MVMVVSDGDAGDGDNGYDTSGGGELLNMMVILIIVDSSRW